MSELVLESADELGAGPAELAAAALPTVRAGIDTYANQARPDTNFGGSARLRLNGPGGADDCRSFIFFARPFPLDATILQATLKVYLGANWPGEQTITAKRITTRWKEGRLTWDDQPTVTDTNAATADVTEGFADQEIQFDLASMLADVAAGGAWYGVRLELDTNAHRRLWSSETPNASLRPQLELSWILPPLAPTELAPSGARSVSEAKPLLTWRYHDPENEAQTSSQVQIDSEDAFVAPLSYDSGKVANAESRWDLADTAYAGLADGDTRFWRVRVWDEGDLVSEWSDVEEIRRTTKGMLTIVNPAAFPNDFVEETTPPLDWTFTGRAQERATVRLYELAEFDIPGKLLHRWNVETESSVTVPPNLLKSGKTYRVVVRVWDDFDRQAMAGDPDYVEADRDFTYERSGTPAAVTALTAVPDGPKVVLTWERATQPDWFSVSVDGEERMQRIDPEDVFVAGTTYSIDWWRAVGGQEATYEVEAVVNDAGKFKHSDGNATAEATTDVGGVWLVDDDPGDTLAVLIADRQQSDLSIGETGETFTLVGSRKPVRITESVRGHEGSISGILLSTDARDDFLELKGRLRPAYRLIQSTLNIPVALGAVGTPPRTAPGGRYDVRAEVFQVDEFPMALAGE